MSNKAEVCLNLWLVVDQSSQLIYRAAARAYAISGSDEDKGIVLKKLSGSDFCLAKHFSLTHFRNTVVADDGSKRTVGGLFLNNLDFNLPSIIETISSGLEEDFISQPIITSNGHKMYRMQIPNEPYYVLTFLFEGESGELRLRP